MSNAPAIDEKDRGTWASHIEFVLSAIGYAIGFGNVWRFPFLLYDSGGGAFLIPYIIMLVLVGLPLFFLELVIGQYSGTGPTLVYMRMSPIMSGLGFSMLYVVVVTGVYYNVILGYCFYYLFAGFSSELPWVHCPEGRLYCYEPTVENASAKCGADCVTPAEDFYYRMMGWEVGFHDWCNFGDLEPKLVLCVLLAWILVAASLIQGIKTSGKVVYFTATFPFISLILLLCYGASLDGSGNGIGFYLKADPEKLGNPKIWMRAAGQIFYSLGIGFGGLIVLASYNKFDDNCHRDTIFISLCNSATSFLAGFAIFALLGFLAEQTGGDVSTVVAEGFALTFIVVPEALSKTGAPHFWSFCFFLMMITLGLDSMFVTVENVITPMLDHFPQWRNHKPVVVSVSCFIGFLLSLSYCASNGQSMMDLLDFSAADWNLLLLGCFEALTVSYVYGINNFWADVEEMGMKIPKVLKIYWTACLTFFTPAILLSLVVWGFAQPKDPELPLLSTMGSLISASSMLFLPAGTINAMWNRRKSNCKDTVFNKELIKPTSNYKRDKDRSVAGAVNDKEAGLPAVEEKGGNSPTTTEAGSQ